MTFREGLEAFLIVGVIVAYLRRTGRDALVRGVHVGLGVSAVTCTAGAWGWYRWTQAEEGGPNQSLYEGGAALIAAVLVGALLWQTLRMGKRLRGEIESRLARATTDRTGNPGKKAIAGVALVTTLLVTREGLEAILYLGVQAFSIKAMSLAIGSAIGLCAAGVLAWLWSRFSARLHIGAVLRVTAVFLAMFLVQLLVYGAHELSESGLIPDSQAFHDASERFGPDGDIGHVLAYSLVAAPLLYLIFARHIRSRSSAS